MKNLSALGITAGGFFTSPPPRAVVATIVWVVARSHPVVGTMVVLAVVAAARSPRD